MTTHPTPYPDARDLLAPWALDAVDDHERSVVERAIAADPELALEARGLLETAAVLAGSRAVTPPTHLRDAVLTAIAAEAAEPSRAASTPTAPDAPRRAERRDAARRRSTSPWSRFALAAAVAGALAVPTAFAVQNGQRASQAEQQVSALEAAMREPGARLVQADVDGGGRAAAVITDDDAVFTASDLPDLDPDLAYQLWRQDGDHMVSAGVLDPSGGGVTTTVAADVPVQVLAISVEPAGGSDAPTSDPVVVLAAD
ncbi:anti-sigma factor [Litorihabitans aurantiacus]|uniref:Regulator of SigK n=1 Tax=Litorihabitans aurantiacus TaxID=1930061 RepID=A0AA37UWA7_9MICO|nr:anti-sigma factor [Litorihabitans aurantiacus]GMA30247.1 hypothetical protein GCM10025875_02390 [Litorihabitans aurantiacus]